jgi:hypothetical protein
MGVGYIAQPVSGGPTMIDRRTVCRLACLGLLAIILAACASGPPRRVSEPAASIQQLTVGADGAWTIELRLQNYSSVPMRFERIELELATGDVAAGRLVADPAITIGPESADLVAVRTTPTAAARMLVADALAGRRGVAYALEGTLTAAPADRGGSQRYEVERRSALSPVPGLPGVLR